MLRVASAIADLDDEQVHAPDLLHELVKGLTGARRVRLQETLRELRASADGREWLARSGPPEGPARSAGAGGWGRSGLCASRTDYSAAPDPPQGPIRVRRYRGIGQRARMGPCSSVARPDSGRMTKTRVLVAENHPSI